MTEFFTAVGSYTFLQLALAGGLMASVAAGVVGTYVVTRRIAFLAGSIAHFALGGMGAARYLAIAHGWTALTPLHGALIAALVAAVVVGVVSLRARQREDTVIGALWAVGMAVGILFISRTPGYNEDLMSYLFGNILMIGPDQLWLLAGLNGAVVLTVALLYSPLQAVCFDEEFARLRGLPVDLLFIILLVLVALTVVVLTTVVGLVLVIALLTLPAAVAGHLSRRLWGMMLWASLLGALFIVGGVALSYSPGVPAGATIVLVAGAAYLTALAVKAMALRVRRRGG